jgi:hypothetical protein
MPKDMTRGACPYSLPQKITTIAFAAALLSASTPTSAAEARMGKAQKT